MNHLTQANNPTNSLGFFLSHTNTNLRDVID